MYLLKEASKTQKRAVSLLFGSRGRDAPSKTRLEEVKWKVLKAE